MFYDRDFIEPIARFRVMYQDVLPPEHQAEYRLRGIDPATLWSLKWSFDCPDAAARCLDSEVEDAPSFRTYKLVDARPACMAAGYKAAHEQSERDLATDEFSRRPNEQGWFIAGYDLYARTPRGAGFIEAVRAIRADCGVSLPGAALIARSIM